MKAYVINLDKDAERLRFMMDRLEMLGIQGERIEAIPARDMTPDMMEQLRKPRADGFTVRWKNSEAACLFSHGKAWRKIAEGRDRYGLVLEDDVHLAAILKEFMIDDDWIPDDAQIIRLETSTSRVALGKARNLYGRKLARLNSTAWCAGAYIISRETAQYLIMQEQPLYDHADAYLFSRERSPLARELCTYQVYPALAIQDKFHSGQPLFESNIEVASDKTAKPSGNIITAAIKTLQGYKRIQFRD